MLYTFLRSNVFHKGYDSLRLFLIICLCSCPWCLCICNHIIFRYGSVSKSRRLSNSNLILDIVTKRANQPRSVNYHRSLTRCKIIHCHRIVCSYSISCRIIPELFQLCSCRLHLFSIDIAALVQCIHTCIACRKICKQITGIPCIICRVKGNWCHTAVFNLFARLQKLVPGFWKFRNSSFFKYFFIIIENCSCLFKRNRCNLSVYGQIFKISLSKSSSPLVIHIFRKVHQFS